MFVLLEIQRWVLLDHPRAVVLDDERRWTAAETLAEIESGRSP
ncbi:MAG TPA: hypothetical protein VMY40_06435 [Anaerolineae bacterium]|nr:hypothetical protein [Anaerolineae bacterium]